MAGVRIASNSFLILTLFYFFPSLFSRCLIIGDINYKMPARYFLLYNSDTFLFWHFNSKSDTFPVKTLSLFRHFAYSSYLNILIFSNSDTLSVLHFSHSDTLPILTLKNLLLSYPNTLSQFWHFSILTHFLFLSPLVVNTICRPCITHLMLLLQLAPDFCHFLAKCMKTIKLRIYERKREKRRRKPHF